jgi:hypothetical protein
VRDIILRLLRGKALEQTVGFLVEEATDRLVGIVSVRPKGRPENAWQLDLPEFYRRLCAGVPYVNLLVRDRRFEDTVLSDGDTRVGPILVRVAMELIARECPGQSPPRVWALVKRDNSRAIRAFARNAFLPDPRSLPGGEQLVLIRSAGKELPCAPRASAFQPVSAGTSREGTLAA